MPPDRLDAGPSETLHMTGRVRSGLTDHSYWRVVNALVLTSIAIRVAWSR